MSANVTSPAITTAPESGEKNYHSIWFIAYESKVVQKHSNSVDRMEFSIAINVNLMQQIVNLELKSVQVKFQNVKIQNPQNQNQQDFQKLKVRKVK